jgi:hypothetical protein
VTKRGQRGFAHFFKAGHAAGAHGGEAEGESRRFNGGRSGSRVSLLAQLRGGFGLPLRGELIGARRRLTRVQGPQVAIPAGRDDAGAVTRSSAEAAVGPGDPGGFNFFARQVFEQRLVFGGCVRSFERAHVPSADDGGNWTQKFSQRLAQLRAHPGLAQGFAAALALAAFGGLGLAHDGHGGVDCGEHGDGSRTGRRALAVVNAALFDESVPEGLAVGVAGGFG